MRIIAPALLGLGMLAVPPATALASNADMARIADGRAWTISAPDGRSAKATFNPDGSARMRVGILSMRGSWRERSGRFCFTTPRQGERCMTLRAVGDGYRGVSPEGTISFTR